MMSIKYEHMMVFFRTKWQEFRAHNELQKIIANMNWLFLNTAIRMAVGFFVGIVVVRYLGPTQYGLLNYGLAIVVFCSVFAKLGLESIAIRELVVRAIAPEKLLGTVFYLKLWGGIVAAVIAVIVAYVVNGDMFIVLITGILALTLIFQATDVVDYWFQSHVISKYVAWTRISATVAIAIIKIGLVALGASLIWFVAVTAVEAAIIAIGFMIAYLRKKGHIDRWVFDMTVARQLFRDAWPLILSAISVMIYMRIDQLMIGNMLGYDALGQYSVAVTLSEMWYFIPTIIAASVFPAIIQTKKRDETLYYARLQKLYDMMTWLAIAIALPMTFLSGWIVETLYGAEYAQAGDVLMIYIWAGVFVFTGVASGKWLLTENLQRYSFYFTGGASIVNVVLNVFLIKYYGINGAAYATLISYGVSVMVVPLFFKKTRILTYMLFKSTVFFRFLNSKKIKC
jgi:O-antigen/teichoic acid export membrane protein